MIVAASRGGCGGTRRTGAPSALAAVGDARLRRAAGRARTCRLQRETGFARPLDEAALYSADWRAYLASSALGASLDARADRALERGALPGIRRARRGIAGARGRMAPRRTRRAKPPSCMASLAVAGRAGRRSGRTRGLYSALYHAVPVLDVAAGAGAVRHRRSRSGCRCSRASRVSQWLPRVRRANALAAIVIADRRRRNWPRRCASARCTPFASAYRVLATLPPGPVIELPFLVAGQPTCTATRSTCCDRRRTGCR